MLGRKATHETNPETAAVGSVFIVEPELGIADAVEQVIEFICRAFRILLILLGDGVDHRYRMADR